MLQFEDGIFYANNYSTSKLVILDPDGNLSEAPGTSSHGICFDTAGNLIQRNDGLAKNPNKKSSTINPRTSEAIRQLKRQGWTIAEIAKQLELTENEVDLVLQLPE